VTFGLKLAQAYAEFERARARLVAARAEIATCAISGAPRCAAGDAPRSTAARSTRRRRPAPRRTSRGGRAGSSSPRPMPSSSAPAPASSRPAPRSPPAPSRGQSAALQVTHLDRQPLDRRGDDAQHREEHRVAVARDDHRGAGGGRVLLRGPEGLLGDAAQAQPGADREPHGTSSLSTTPVRRASAKSRVTVASGPIIRSTEECEIPRPACRARTPIGWSSATRCRSGAARATSSPCSRHRVALDQPIGVLARHAGLGQRQQHPLRVDETAGHRRVLRPRLPPQARRHDLPAGVWLGRVR
jgi:hypothetical protein